MASAATFFRLRIVPGAIFITTSVSSVDSRVPWRSDLILSNDPLVKLPRIQHPDCGIVVARVLFDGASPLRSMVRSSPPGTNGMFQNCTFSGVTRDLVAAIFSGGIRQARLAGARF